MIRIAICDDDIIAANRMEDIISTISHEVLDMDVFCSGIELLKQIEQNISYQIILLDIEMPETNGIETALELRKKDKEAVIIFVTNYKEYVYQVFEVLPFRFLEKPVSAEKLRGTITDAVTHLQERKGYFSYRKGTTDFQIPIKDIIYFESDNRKTRIFTNNHADEFYGKFRLLMTKLSTSYFLQVHTSYIVNMDYIASFNDRDVNLKNGISLPVSLKFRESARLNHMRFLERRCGEW